ncbi:MAG: hypothetical protein IPM30_14945 [Burkholderiales bacterium]|nr:hypothetical protein [Burkholderiales bacterium]
MDYASCLPEAVQLVLAFDDLSEEAMLREAIRSRAGLLAHLSPEAVCQPD